MKNLLRGVFAVFVLGCCLIILAGFAGQLHPLGDSLSLLRIPAGLLCLASLAFPMQRIVRAGVAAVAFFALLTTAPLFWGTQSGGNLTLYTKNLLYRNSELSSLADDIRASGAEVVTLQEVGKTNDAFLAMVASDYPYQHLCRFIGWSGVAVLSKTPFVGSPHCSDRTGVAAAQIEKDGNIVWVASVHLPWPYPYAHEQSAQSAVALFDELEGPVVIAGDFNIFPWASSARRIRAASGTMVAGPVRPTYNLYGAPLFLDHVYAPNGGNVTYRELLGSDHLGVVARLDLG